MHISVVSDDGDLVRLELDGRIVQEAGVRRSEPISELLGPDVYCRRVLLSLAKTEFIGSSGLSWLVVAQKRFRGAGGKLIVHSVPPVVRDVIKMMRLELVLDMAETEEEAEKAVEGDGK
jgi:anti-anti-sigma factor